MFSDKVSSTERCRPHSECKTRQRQVFPGNTTSDVQCVDVRTPQSYADTLSDVTTPFMTATPAAEIMTTIIPGSDMPSWSLPVVLLCCLFCGLSCVMGYSCKNFNIFERIRNYLRYVQSNIAYRKGIPVESEPDNTAQEV